MNISSIFDTGNIIENAFKQTAMRVSPRSSKRPNLDTALKCVVNQIEYDTTAAVAAQVAEVLQEAYETYELIAGERPEDADEAEAWDDGMDEAVEEVIEPYKEHLSASWLGEYMIGTSVHDEKGMKTFCDALAKEYYREITKMGYEEKQRKTPVQIMASAGILKADVEAALNKLLNPTEEEKQAMNEKQSTELEAVAVKIADHIGKDFQTMPVYDDIDLASDDDDGLAFGAAARLGLDEDDVRVLQGERLVVGNDIMDIVLKQIETIHEGSGKKKGKKGMKKAKDLNPGADPDIEETFERLPAENKKITEKFKGAISTDVMQALKACGAKDDTMAQGIGTSRATYNNYANGKAPFEPTEAQRSFIRSQLVEKANALLEALGELDGTEPQTVF